MRNHVWFAVLVFMSAQVATAQVFDQLGNNAKGPAAGGPPADAQAGDQGGAGPENLIGPPPNVMFSVIDVDGDGIITTRELRRAAAQLKKLDVDKDGNITLAEVSSLGAPGGAGGDPAQFMDRLMQYDTNRDGRLTPDEVPEQVQPMLAGADQNGDGAIDRAELAAAMESMRNRFPGGPAAGPWPGGPAGARGPGGLNQPFDATQMTGRLMQHDLNGDGKLSANEVPPQAMGMLRGGDQNNDGAIDAAELRAIMARMGDRARAMEAGAANERPDRRGRRRGDDERGRERTRNED